MADPAPKSIFDVPRSEMDERRLDDQADAEIEAGKGVPHERVREWLSKLARGEKVPPPAA